MVTASATCVGRIMTTDVVCATADLGLDVLVSLMMEQRLGCVPVIDARRHPIGVVTKLDLVEHAVIDDHCATVDDVMMPLALTVRDTCTIADAAKLMLVEDIHHVIVVTGDGEIAGVVSSRDLVRWLVMQESP